MNYPLFPIPLEILKFHDYKTVSKLKIRVMLKNTRVDPFLQPTLI